MAREFLAGLMVVSFLSGAIPASLLPRGFDSYRSVAVLPIIFILIIFGLDVCVKIVNKLPSQLKIFSLIVFLTGTVYWSYRETHALFDYEYKERAAIDWHYGYPQILEYFLEYYQEYDALIVTETVAYAPDLYIRFYDADSRYTKIKVGTLAEIDGNPRVLFAARPWEVDLARFTAYKIIRFPNGRGIAFYIGEPVPPETEE
jgi:hypothetical protein